MSEHKIVSAKPIMEALFAAGVVPPHCRKIIIELEVNDVARIYFECYGDERLLEVVRQVAPEIKAVPKVAIADITTTESPGDWQEKMHVPNL